MPDEWLTKHQAKRREQAKRTKKFVDDISSIAKSLDGIDLSLAKIASFVSMSNTVEVKDEPRGYEPKKANNYCNCNDYCNCNVEQCSKCKCSIKSPSPCGCSD